MVKTVRSIAVCSLLVMLCETLSGSEAYAAKKPKGSHIVTVTAYTDYRLQSGKRAAVTASRLKIGSRHYGKVVAFSRDLAKQYKFGDRFQLWVNGKVYDVEFQDLMPRHHRCKIDFLLPSTAKCVQFGVHRGVLVPVKSRVALSDSDPAVPNAG